MRVSELILLLEKCPKDWIVMYDAENALKNGSLTDENNIGVDDVLMGCGTERGFVFLSEDSL